MGRTAKPKPEVEEEEVEETEEEETEEEVEVATAAPKSKKGEVTVKWRLGERTYSEKVHGPDYEDLAQQFINKHGGVIV